VKLSELGECRIPETVAEIGPGDSLGVGLAALLSGAERYFAFDTVRYAGTARNVSVLDELVGLFRNRSDIPGEDEFPEVLPRLSTYGFPRTLLTDGAMEKSLDPARVAQLRRTLSEGEPPSGNRRVFYAAPWTDARAVLDATVDLVISQAVLEHVEDLETTYGALSRWLKPGGRMSHLIDFSCHGLTRSWNGHWVCPESVWALIKGKRPYLINREPLSAHLDWMERFQFKPLSVIAYPGSGGIGRRSLAPAYHRLTDGDLNTHFAFIVAMRPAA
jgi:SAM-dependent methyltransferase